MREHAGINRFYSESVWVSHALPGRTQGKYLPLHLCGRILIEALAHQHHVSLHFDENGSFFREEGMFSSKSLHRVTRRLDLLFLVNIPYVLIAALQSFCIDEGKFRSFFRACETKPIFLAETSKTMPMPRLKVRRKSSSGMLPRRCRRSNMG